MSCHDSGNMLKMRKRDMSRTHKFKKDLRRRPRTGSWVYVWTLGSTIYLFFLLSLPFDKVESKRSWWIKWLSTNVLTTKWNLAFHHRHHLFLYSSVNLLTQPTLRVTIIGEKRKYPRRNLRRCCWVNSPLILESQWWDELPTIYRETQWELLKKKTPFNILSGAYE